MMSGLRRVFDSFGEFSDFLERKAMIAEATVEIVADEASKVLKKNARDIYGDATKLAELAPSTQAERERLGYSPNEPLKRTGELLRDNVERAHEGHLAGAGSSEPVALYHEFGYVNARTGTSVPPRPVFKIALEESAKPISELMQGAVAITLGFAPALPPVEKES